MTRTCTYLDPRQRERCTECGNTRDLCLCSTVDDRAHDRLTSLHGKFLTAVYRELSQVKGQQEHVFEKIVSKIGALGIKLVDNTDSGTPAESEIARDLVEIGVLLTILAADGTPEYTYTGA